jgi:hypothetical protein
MKTLLAVLILGGALTGGSAVAGSYGSGFHAQSQDKSGFAYSKGQGKRYQRVERPQRYVPSGPPPDRGGSGRLTDDERRQLHRDLDKANRELYRGRRDR